MNKITHGFGLAAMVAAVAGGCTSKPTSALPNPEIPGFMRASAAVVQSKYGNVHVAIQDRLNSVRTDMGLPEGSIISTGDRAETYLHVNGLTSTVKITENSVLELTLMRCSGNPLNPDTATVLTVKRGTVHSSVRKLSANSYYEVQTPKGVAEVRGTDFSVAVTPGANGEYHVTYLCVTGMLLVEAPVNGVPVTQILTTGQKWVPGEGEVTGTQSTVLTGGHYGITIVPSDPQTPHPPGYIQPFHGNGPPNPAVDTGRNPYIHVTPPPPPPPPPAHH